MLTALNACDEAAAYVKGKPIRNPEDMPRQIICLPMDKEWVDSLWDRWWATDYQGCCLPEKCHQILSLRDRLLSFGGQQASMERHEPDLEQIQNRGQLWYGDRLTIQKGEDIQCHRNSSYLWAANKSRVMLATGYALSIDGMWRQHSWCIWIKARANRVIETTVPRAAYFGFVMTPTEAESFLEDNRT